jgi:alcohol dehydrogenase class IV
VYFLDDRLIPNTAILDPQLTAGLPRGLTGSTGLDALTHAIEAVVSRTANPISEGLALQAIRMIAEHLPAVIERPGDLEARVQMQLASTMAGWAFSVAGVGLVHGLSHALGARHHVPHGTANGILLPHVMRFNVEAAGPKLAQVARALGCNGTGDEAALASAGADVVAKLLVAIGHPQKLSEVGVKAGDLAACAELALGDGATATNPRPVRSADEAVAVYRQAL